MYCISFPVLKPLACGRQSRCLGWTYTLPGGQKFRIEFSALSVGFPQRRPSNLIKIPQFINSPGVRFINHPACSLSTTPFFCNKSSFCTAKKKTSPLFALDSSSLSPPPNQKKKKEKIRTPILFSAFSPKSVGNPSSLSFCVFFALFCAFFGPRT